MCRADYIRHIPQIENNRKNYDKVVEQLNKLSTFNAIFPSIRATFDAPGSRRCSCWVGRDGYPKGLIGPPLVCERPTPIVDQGEDEVWLLAAVGGVVVACAACAGFLRLLSRSCNTELDDKSSLEWWLIHYE